MASAAVKHDVRYKLIAYVCGNACIRYADAIGTMDIDRIYIQRPSGCRYAIVEHWVLGATEVLVFDLYEVTWADNLQRHVLPAEPVHRGDCVEAAIMATFMTYVD